MIKFYRLFYCLVILLLSGMTTASFAQSSLVISQYIETSSGSTPKGIELWNVSGADIDFAATPLAIFKGTNGAAPAEDVTVSSGILPAGKAWVIGTSDIGTYLTTAGISTGSYTEYGFSFNGDDALEIYLDGIKQDVFGDPGTGDPGTGWSANGVTTYNTNIGLKASITAGDTDGWTDPSERFEVIADGVTLTGFGVEPGGTPPTPPTLLSFNPASGSVAEDGGTFSFTVAIANPSATAATTAEVVLIEGDASDISAYSTQTITFPAGSAEAQTLSIDITDDELVEGTELLTFALQNVSGGEKAIAINGNFILTLTDNDVQASRLVISQYIDTNSGTTPKGIELWNVSDSDIDFAATPLAVYKGSNGAAPAEDVTVNSGILPAGEVWVIGTSDIGTYLTTAGITNGYYTDYGFTFNGDDALEIYLDGIKQDVFGDPGTGDPGTGWSANGVATLDANIGLKTAITAGDIDGWTDPSERFEVIADGVTLTGFGLKPENYYSGLEDLSGEALKNALHFKIRNHTRFPYTASTTDVWDILKDTDEDPANPNNIILIYTGRSQDKSTQDTGSNGNDVWNREHIWPKSHGFPNETDTAYTDVHHLRPADKTVNSTRNNKDFDMGGTADVEAPDTFTDADSWEPRDEVKGDVARMIFYMATRYEGTYDLEIVDYTNTASIPVLGKLSVLYEWHHNDPVDDWERSRNQKIYESYQGNRNPFIDHPEYVSLIWGEGGIAPTEPPVLDLLAGVNFDQCGTEIPGMIIKNIEGENSWGCTGMGNNSTGALEINGYGNPSSIDWAIFPAVDLGGMVHPGLRFNTLFKYGSSLLKVMASTDYDGSSDPATANWTELAALNPAELTAELWTAQALDLTAYQNQTVYIGLQYVAPSDPTRWTVDDFLVEELPSENMAPLVNGKIADATASTGQAFSYSFGESLFTDPNVGDVLTYSATLADDTALPAWLSFDGTTRTFSGTPETAAALAVKVMATDEGGLAASTGFNILIEETPVDTYLQNFDDCTITEWTAYSVSSDKNWECTEYGVDGTSAYQINGYGQTETSEDWLITPRINIEQADAEMIFMARTKYGANLLELLVSEDYDGQSAPSTASWTELSAAFPDLNSDVWSEVTADLSNYEGKSVFVGFRYYAETEPARWTIDNVAFTGVSTAPAPAVNHEPVVNGSLADVKTSIGQALEIPLPTDLFTDADPDDVMSYSATLASGEALPEWLVFDAAQMMLSGMATEGSQGDYEILITATDKEGAQASTSFMLSVEILAAVRVEEPAFVMAYPNPVQDVLYLKMDKGTSRIEIRILSPVGQVHKSYRLPQSALAAGEAVVDFSSFEKGMWLINIISADKAYTFRIYKK